MATNNSNRAKNLIDPRKMSFKRIHIFKKSKIKKYIPQKYFGEMKGILSKNNVKKPKIPQSNEAEKKRRRWNNIISGQAFRKLGEGGCGVIYEVALVKCPKRRFACKAECAVPDEDPTLPMEHKVISLMIEKNSAHAVELLEKGQSDNYQYIVMSLLGPSLDAIRMTIPLKKFSTFSTCVVIIQALDSLKELHDIGYIHRDVKPANFAIGALGTQKQRLIHILDFGIARQYLIKGENGEKVLRPPRRIVPFRGTMRYCSVDTQNRKEQGRHDDLWSLFYMIIEFLKGSLPWSGMASEEEVMFLKSDTQELFNGIDDEFVKFGKHLTVLRYQTKPGYKLLRNLLLNVFIRRDFNANMKVDWEQGGRFDTFFEKKTKTLPSVTVKDMTEIDLERILKIPKKYKRITMQQVLHTENSIRDDELNTAQDDTLDLDVDEKKIKQQQEKLKEKERATTTTATTTIGKYRYKSCNSMMAKSTKTTKQAKNEERKWKIKQEEFMKNRIKKRAEAEERTMVDLVVPEDEKTRKKKLSREQTK